jgi:hypothetical protein
MNDNWAKYGAATGIVFVILLVIGFVVVAPSPPNSDAPANEFASYYSIHQNGIRAALIIVSISLFFYIWFLGSVSSALRKVAGDPRLPTVAFAGGLLGAAFTLIGITATGAAAYHPTTTSAEVIRALNDVALVAGAPAFAGFTALLLATALVILRTEGLPEWLGWLCAAGAATQPLTIGAMLTDSGVFAPDGVFGLILPFAGLVVPIAALSVVLTRGADAPGGGGVGGWLKGIVGA